MTDTQTRDQKITYNEILDRLNRSISIRYPHTVDFVRTLAPLLNVTQCTIYNKIKGKTRFSVEEFFVILHQMKIPLGEIMGELRKSESFPMELLAPEITDSRTFSDILDWYYEILSLSSASGNSRLMISSTTIPEFCLIDFEWLSAFSYQKYLFYNKGVSGIIPLTEIVNLREHIDQATGCLDYIRNLKVTEYILSISIIRNYLLELRMFYKYSIITKEEAGRILDELKQLLSDFEKVCSDGVLQSTGKKIDIFYHDTQMFDNIYLINSDNLNVGFIATQHLKPIIARDSATLDLLKKWYENWKRSSIPISVTGLPNRLEFLSEQQKALDSFKDFVGI